jgi:hypothetical protein
MPAIAPLRNAIVPEALNGADHFSALRASLAGTCPRSRQVSVDAPLLALPIALAQLTLQDLGGGCPRQCIDEID